MPCTNETCAASEGLEICLFCGHSFCATHRGEQDGLAACTGCLKAAHEQRAAIKQRARVAAAAPISGSGSGDGPIQIKLAPPPPLPAPSPRVAPWAAVATVPAGGYLFWFLGWLSRRHDLPGWIQPAGTVLGAGFVFAAVWVIAKSRMTAR